MSLESPTRTALVRRARRINRELAKMYPDAHTELNFTTPLELLVATILSAQSTDQRVNMVTPVLFARYHTAADYAAANREDVEKIIGSTGFFRRKYAIPSSAAAAANRRFTRPMLQWSPLPAPSPCRPRPERHKQSGPIQTVGRKEVRDL